MLTVDDILAQYEGPRRQTSTGWKILCPLHNDHDASLSIAQKGDTLLMYCHGCAASFKDLVKAFGGTTTDAIQQFAKQQIMWALDSPWVGRSGPTDRAAYIAICKRVYLTGNPILGLPVREIAMWANISHMSASRARKRLCGKVDKKTGEVTDVLLENLLHRDEVYGTKYYRIVGHPVICYIQYDICNRYRDDSSSVNDVNVTDTGRYHCYYLNHDLFVYNGGESKKSGLGQEGAQLWHFLQNPISQKDLVTKSGRREDLVRDKLIVMETLHLVTKADDLWVRSPSADLGSAAMRLGVLGRLSERADGVGRQRKDFLIEKEKWNKDFEKRKCARLQREQQELEENKDYQKEQELLGHTFSKRRLL